MGLFKKMKDILFDEEEYTEQIKITPEMRNEQTPDKIDSTKIKEKVYKEEVKEPIKEEIREHKKPMPEIQMPVVEQPKVEPTSEREIFKTNANYPFFDFDEEEFISQKPHHEIEQINDLPVRTSNVIEYEKKKRVEKKTEYGTEVTETIERRKFKPSPIISPVYGILDRDYNPDDIVHRDSEKVDFKEVRNKAFGDTKELPKIKEKEVLKPEVLDEKPVVYEETETVAISKPDEKEKKVKTIDELLENTSDVVVDVNADLEIPKPQIKEAKPKKEIKEHQPSVDDTLENDLFDLIDSMYDSKEEGE